jgi:hypothetical protein
VASVSPYWLVGVYEIRGNSFDAISAPYPTAGQEWNVSAAVNTGNTAAVCRCSFAGVIRRAAEDAPQLPGTSRPNSTHDVILPHGTLNFSPFDAAGPISREQIEAIENGNLSAWIVGRIDYPAVTSRLISRSA